MDTAFKDVVEAFDRLKARFQGGEISRQEFIDEMKKLRLKDDQGRFWMIGAQTGKWYFFDGKDWVQDEPPSQKDKKAICIYCGFENRIEAETCGRCGGNLKGEEPACPKCGANLKKPYLTCSECGSAAIGDGQLKDVDFVKIGDVGTDTSAFVVRSVQPLSFLLFGGVLGLLAGILWGAFAGATTFFRLELEFLPASLLELRGKLLGAFIYAILGGIAGFSLFAAAAFLKALVVNLILSLIGGIKFRAGKAGLPKGKKPEAEGPAESEPFGLMK